VCFWAMAGKRPMRHHKVTHEGFEERRALLHGAYEGVQIPNLYEAASLVHPAKSDDVFDAMAAAWTASRFAQGLAGWFPADPPADARGLRMEMVY
jgi:predicted RNase H-like nuclease